MRTMIRRSTIRRFGGDRIRGMRGMLGLERHGPFVMAGQALGVFSVGILVGAALGLTFAPKTGGELRTDIADRFDGLRSRLANASERFQKSAS